MRAGSEDYEHWTQGAHGFIMMDGIKEVGVPQCHGTKRSECLGAIDGGHKAVGEPQY